jgi:Zn-dependent metalloprotease
MAVGILLAGLFSIHAATLEADSGMQVAAVDRCDGCIKIQGESIGFVKSYFNERLHSKLDEIGVSDQHDYEFRVVHPDTDDLGYIHVRLKEFYKSIPVEGSSIVAHVRRDTLYAITGEIVRFKPIDAKPTLSIESATDIAVNDAYQTVCDNPGSNIFRKVTPEEKIQIADREQNGEKAVQFLKYDGIIIIAGALAYRLMVLNAIKTPMTMLYLVDAHSGKLLGRSSLERYFDPPSSNGSDTTISGSKLTKECDGSCVTSFTGWKDLSQGTRYFLWSKGNAAAKIGPWGIFDWNRHKFQFANDSTPICDSIDPKFDWIRSTSSDWGTNDRMAISAAKNADFVLRYLADSLQRYGVTNSGDTTKIYIRMAPDDLIDNSVYWDGNTNYFFGIAGPLFDSITTLNSVAHEMGHGLIYYTAHFGGVSHEGTASTALHESAANIFAAAVEFSSQLNGTSSYPGSLPGKSDWLIGEDHQKRVHWRSVYDLMYPLRPIPSDTVDTVYAGDSRITDYPYHRPYNTYYEYDTVFYKYLEGHAFSGMEAFALYLLAAGVSTQKTNMGYAFGPFNGIGTPMAMRVALRANIYNCNEYSAIRDCYFAWRKAAQDYIAEGKLNSSALAIVDSVWKAVGVDYSYT